MQSNELVSDQVVAGSKTRGDLALPLLLGIDDAVAPSLAAQWWGGHAHLIDLEPALLGAIARLEVSSAFVQPNHHRALLVGPLLPLGDNAITSLDGGVERS